MNSPPGAGLNWFYVREGRRLGPFDRAPLIAELLTLDAPEAVLVWRTGLPAWTKAGRLDELRGELPPPVPGTLPGQKGSLVIPDSDPVASEEWSADALPPLPSETPMSDGDFAGDLGQGSGPGEESSPVKARATRPGSGADGDGTANGPPGPRGSRATSCPSSFSSWR